MNAFVTGSRVYGKYTEKSDVDLVLLVSHADIGILRTIADGSGTNPDNVGSDAGPGGLSASLRFGKLNLLCVTDPIQYEVWKRGTSMLKCENYVDRDLAVAMFELLRKHCGLCDSQPTIADARFAVASKKRN